MSWKQLAQCHTKNCVFTIQAGLIHTHEVCPFCGDSKTVDMQNGVIVDQKGWVLFTGKTTSLSKWYNPFTWGKFHIEAKDKP